MQSLEAVVSPILVRPVREQLEHDRRPPVDALHAEFTTKGAKGLTPVVDQPYGMRDVACADLDGNKIGFGKPV